MTQSDSSPGRSAPKRERRSALRSVALVVLSLVVAVVVAEVLLQVSGLTPTRGGVFTVSAEAYERIPGIFEPVQNAEVRDHPELRYDVSIDSLGFRTPDFPRVPAGDEIRILFVGDGFVFGSFVDDDGTLPSQLQAALGRHCTAPVTVINAGLPGSTIRDQIPMVERALELQPDLVILQFSEDDIRELVGPSMWQDLARNREAKSGFPLGLVYPMIRNSALWNLALRVQAAWVSRRIDDALEEADPDAATGPGAPLPEMPEARAAYRELLLSLRDRLAEANVPFVFALYPAHLSVYGRWDDDQLAWAEKMARELDVATVSFLDALRNDGRRGQELYHLPWDGSATAAGYRVAAERLAQALMERDLPAGGCA